MPKTAKPKLTDISADWCRQLGWKDTGPRRAIVGAVLEADGYFDAETLLEVARKIDRNVSRATVYRALADLCEGGMLRSFEFGDGKHRFCVRDPNGLPMAEIYVVDCGKIVEVPAPFLTWYAQSVTSKAGYELIGQRLQTFARCPRKDTAACDGCAAHPALTIATRSRL